MNLEVMTREQMVYSGEADSVVLPAWQGEMGVLADHADYVVALARGLLRFRAAGTSHTLAIAGGFAEVSRNKVIVLPEEVSEAPAGAD